MIANALEIVATICALAIACLCLGLTSLALFSIFFPHDKRKDPSNASPKE